MLRRLACVLLVVAFVLASLPTSIAPEIYAQDGSPVPVDPLPTEIPLPQGANEQSSSDPEIESVTAADFEGNTPLGPHTNPPLTPLPRTDVYIYISQVTVAGQTDVIDGTDGNGSFDAPGFRSDNAKVITIKTTASFDGNLNVCVIFDGSNFFNPSAIDLLYFTGGAWLEITNYLDANTVCGYASAFGVFAVAEPGTTPPTATPSLTATETATPSSTATSIPTESSTATPTATVTETSTSAPSRIQFALDNVYVTYLEIPTSGSTTGAVLSGSELPSLPGAFLTSNAWFFEVSSTVVQTGNKQLCVAFETATYSDPLRLLILQRTGSSWAQLPGQVLDTLLSEQGTHCAYIASFGEFALVEQALATTTATRTPSRTPSSTATVASSATRTASPTGTGTSTTTATSTTSPTPTSTATASATPTATRTITATGTATATLGPGSFPTGTILRTTTRVNLRSGASTSTPSLGVLSSGATVTVNGPSVAAGGLTWVPVTTSLGTGWVASKYFVSVPTATPTRTPAPPTVTRTPGGSTPSRTPTRTPTRPPGGFIAGDAVRTTANVNLRSAPGTSTTILRVVPSKTVANVTGPGVVRSGMTFYPVTISGYPAGYLAGSYLQRVTATAIPSRTRTPTATVVGSTVRYTTNIVNLRRGAGTSYGIVATIPKGTRVNITGTPRRVSGTDWYPIIINGVGSGWMSGAFLTPLPPL